MEDNHGGARKGAGRKPKIEEAALIETMDAIAVPDSVWQSLYVKVLESDVQAIKTWLSYRYGMPKQTVDNNTNVTLNDFNIKDVIQFDNLKP